MANYDDVKSTLSTLNSLLAEADLSDITADTSVGYTELPDGYYLCEVEKSELKESKTSHQPMASFQFKICEDGLDVEMDESGETSMIDIPKTSGRKIFVNYVLKNSTSIKRFAADMLKFEGEVAGEPLLPKEAFMSSETLMDALDILVGMRIYINVSTSEKKDGTKSTWNNLISWKRAGVLGLIS